MNLVNHLWQILPDAITKHRDIKRLNKLRNDVANKKLARKKEFVRNPLSDLSKALTSDILIAEAEIEKIESRYASEWNRHQIS